MNLLELARILCCAVGIIPLLFGTFSRTHRIPGPAAPLAAALFLWGLRAYANLIDPANTRGLISVTDRFCDFTPVLLIMTLYGYMYEAALWRTRQTKRQLAAALRALPAVIAGIGATGHVTFCNRPREMARIVGIDEDKTLARAERSTLWWQTDGDDWDDMVMSTASSGAPADCACDMAALLGLTPWPPPATASVELARGQELADGRAWIVVASPVSSPLSDGSVAIVCALDITELNRLRRQVRQLEKSEAVGALAAGVAHELNNQVMAILCHADQVSAAKREGLGLDAEADADFERHTESIRQAAERVQRMLQHLVKLASPVTDGPRVEMDAEQLVRDAVHLFRPSLPPGVRLAIEIEDDLPTIQADADGVHQVVLNLLLNARDALGEAGRCPGRPPIAPWARMLTAWSSRSPTMGRAWSRVLPNGSSIRSSRPRPRQRDRASGCPSPTASSAPTAATSPSTPRRAAERGSPSTCPSRPSSRWRPRSARCRWAGGQSSSWSMTSGR
jgi:PAS domain-containing protein